MTGQSLRADAFQPAVYQSSLHLSSRPHPDQLALKSEKSPWSDQLGCAPGVLRHLSLTRALSLVMTESVGFGEHFENSEW